MTRRGPVPQVRALPQPTVWDQFVARSGLVTTAALLVVIVSLTSARLHPSPMIQALAVPQSLLMLIVLACVGVLAYRSGAD